MINLIIDIETVANERSKDKKVLVSAPSNYKDPVKIAEYMENAERKERAKFGLSWTTGKICCIGIYDIELKRSTEFIGTKEDTILKDFLQHLKDLDECVTLIGKTSKNFDFPFMVGRLMANRLPIPHCLKNRELMKDIDDIFGFSSASSQRGKLDDYAWGLGIEGKSSHGSEVQEMYNNGQLKEIADYCRQDCLITAQIWDLYR